MRGALAFVFARTLAFAFVLALAPGPALAQPPASDWVTLEIEPFADPVDPLKGPTDTTMTVRASCLLVDQTRTILIAYRVTKQPTWAAVLVSPAIDGAPVESCEAGYVTRTGTLTVTASDQAPAFLPTQIEIEAVAGPPDRAQRAVESVGLSAKYFPVMDVQLAESIATVAPGKSHTFVVKVSNFGNAATRIESTILSADEGLTVQPPAPIILESKQAGGSRVSEDIHFVVSTREESGLVNRVGAITARIVGSYATDDSQGSDESSVSFLVTSRTGGEKSPDPSLLPFPTALVLVAVAIALFARRRA